MLSVLCMYVVLAVEVAARSGWLDACCLRDPALVASSCSQYRNTSLVSDASWLVHCRTAVATAPVTTVRDPRPCFLVRLAAYGASLRFRSFLFLSR